MKIIVCGGRTYFDKEFIFQTLNEINQNQKITTLITGDAPGADSLAISWAKENKINYIVYRAIWDMYGNAAGPIRNEKMIKDNNDAEMLIAFSGGRGTKNAVLLAKKYNLKIKNMEVKK